MLNKKSDMFCLKDVNVGDKFVFRARVFEKINDFGWALGI